MRAIRSLIVCLILVLCSTVTIFARTNQTNGVGATDGTAYIVLTIDDDLSGIKSIKVPQGVTEESGNPTLPQTTTYTPPSTWAVGSEIFTYSVTQNGTYTFEIEDNVGNVRTEVVTVGIIQQYAPVITNLNMSTTAGTSPSITVDVLTTMQITNGYMGPQTLTYSVTPTTGVTQSGARFTLTQNGTYTFKALDPRTNLYDTQVLTITNINSSKPSITVLNDLPTQITNAQTQTMTFNVVSNQLSGFNGVSNITSFVCSDPTVIPLKDPLIADVWTATFTHNGTYVFTATDNYGNTSTYTKVVDNMNFSTPTATYTYNSTPTNTQSLLTVTPTSPWSAGLASKYQTLETFLTTTNGTYTKTGHSFYITSNGTYTLGVRDLAGNVYILPEPIEVHNIDKFDINNVAVARVGNTTATNGTGIFKLVTKDTGVDLVADTSKAKTVWDPDYTGSKAITISPASGYIEVSDNKTYTFTITDVCGNKVPINVNADNISTAKPTISEVAAPTTSPSARPITGVYTMKNSNPTSGFSGKLTYSMTMTPGQLKLIDASTFTYEATFDVNGTYTITALDSLGNTNSITKTITNLDIADVNSGVGIPQISSTLVQTPTNNGINVTSVYQENWFTGFATTYRNLSPSVITNDGSFTNVSTVGGTNGATGTRVWKATSNGTYIPTVTNSAGTITQGPAIVINSVDKNTPNDVTSTQYPDATTYTRGQVTINIFDSLGNAIYDGGAYGKNNWDSGYGLDKNLTVYPPSGEMTVSENGTYYFTITDACGNTYKHSHTVSNINNTKPKITVTTPKLDHGVAGVSTIGVTLSAKDTAPGYTGPIPSMSLVVTPTPKAMTKVGDEYMIDFEINQTYTLTATDALGNVSTATYVIDNIDNSSPTLAIVYNQVPTGVEGLPVTFQVANVWTPGYADKYKTYTFKYDATAIEKDPTRSGSIYTLYSNGIYEFYVETQGGHQSNKTAKQTITCIDVNAPKDLSINADKTIWTKDPVILTLMTADGTAPIQNGSTVGKTIWNSMYNFSKNLTITPQSGQRYVTVNGTYTFTVVDAPGNSTTISYPVGNIDTIRPTLSFVDGTLALDKSSLPTTITFADTLSGVGGLTVKDPTGVVSYLATTPNSDIDKKTISYLYKYPGLYTFTATDYVGNTVVVEKLITNVVVPNQPVKLTNLTLTNTKGQLTAAQATSAGLSNSYTYEKLKATYAGLSITVEDADSPLLDKWSYTIDVIDKYNTVVLTKTVGDVKPTTLSDIMSLKDGSGEYIPDGQYRIKVTVKDSTSQDSKQIEVFYKRNPPPTPILDIDYDANVIRVTYPPDTILPETTLKTFTYLGVGGNYVQAIPFSLDTGLFIATHTDIFGNSSSATSKVIGLIDPTKPGRPPTPDEIIDAGGDPDEIDTGGNGSGGNGNGGSGNGGNVLDGDALEESRYSYMYYFNITSKNAPKSMLDDLIAIFK